MSRGSNVQLTTRAFASVLIATALGSGLSACGSDDENRPGANPAANPGSGASGNEAAGRGVGVNEVDAAYVRQMIPHDAQVVVIATRAAASSTRAEVKEIAREVRESTLEELRALQQFATKHRYDLSKPDTRKDADAQALHTTAEKLGTPITPSTDGDFDKDFVELAITHHEGSLVMSRAVRKHGVDEELAKLSKEQVKALNAQLEQLESVAKGL
ncbi:MAG: DUF305 domain-containing protein [Solirubrobacteraceae bacterium]|nr:DUF305 domain-containing protein [Solirubrobacteraceae bacterium]